MGLPSRFPRRRLLDLRLSLIQRFRSPAHLLLTCLFPGCRSLGRPTPVLEIMYALGRLPE